MKRLQQILTGLLLIQLLVVGVVFWPQGQVQAAGGPLLGDLEAEMVTAVTITDNNDDIVELTRQGEEWVLASGGDYPAAGEEIDQLLNKLLAVKDNRLVTQTAASHSRLEIGRDNFIRRIQLMLEDGSSQTLYMGTSVNPSTTHFRVEGQNEVYLANGLIASDASALARDWIDPVYVSLSRDAITDLVLKNANGTFEFHKTADDTWQYAGLGEGEQLVESQISALLTRITNIRMIEPLGTVETAAYGMDEPLATVTVTQETDEGTDSFTLLVGSQDAADNSYIIKWSESAYYVRVAAFNGDEFVTMVHEDVAEVSEPEEAEETAEDK